MSDSTKDALNDAKASLKENTLAAKAGAENTRRVTANIGNLSPETRAALKQPLAEARTQIQDYADALAELLKMIQNEEQKRLN